MSDNVAMVASSRPRWRRVVAAGAAIVVVVVLLALALDSATPVFYYRPINDYALAVGTVTGNNTWTRVTGVNESAESVTVYVKSMRAPLPGTGDDTVELTVRLTAPLGGRSVIDGSSGVTVARLKEPST